MTQGRRLGQYELLEVLGQGDILTIYRARDTERDRPVVLKLVQSHLQDDADLVARFRARAEELLQLHHPHIVPILDASFEQDALYLVTDIPTGESLDQRRARQGALEVDDAWFIVSQVAEALDFAHEQGVFHHDLRPANIHLKDETALLTDFFVLEAVGATPVYMAPEQLDETSAEAPDRRSDSYSLAVIVYEILAGRPPFEGAASDVAAAHLAQRPLLPRVHNPDLPPAMDAILLKALAKQPKSRYQRAGDLATALHEAVRTARTRRMTDEELLSEKARMAVAAAYKPASAQSEGGVPTWVWVGLGILLIVVIAVIILLVTG